jgi:hypothetical protein
LSFYRPSNLLIRYNLIHCDGRPFFSDLRLEPEKFTAV